MRSLQWMFISFMILVVLVSPSKSSSNKPINTLKKNHANLRVLVKHGIHEGISIVNEILGKDLSKFSNRIASEWSSSLNKTSDTGSSDGNHYGCPLNEAFDGIGEFFRQAIDYIKNVFNGMSEPTKSEIIRMIKTTRSTFVLTARKHLNPQNNANQLKKEILAVQKMMEVKHANPQSRIKTLKSSAPHLSFAVQEAFKHTMLELHKELKALKPETKKSIQQMHLHAQTEIHKLNLQASRSKSESTAFSGIVLFWTTLVTEDLLLFAGGCLASIAGSASHTVEYVTSVLFYALEEGFRKLFLMLSGDLE